MRRRDYGVVRRWLVLLWGITQFGSAAVTSVADASLYAGASGAVGHFEGGSNPDCAEPHEPDCGLCRHLATAGTTPSTDTRTARIQYARLDSLRQLALARPTSPGVLARAPPHFS